MRQYLRLDPHLPDNKEGYPDGALATFALMLCFGEHQPNRGRFRNKQVLAALLNKRSRWISFLIDRHDLVEQDHGVLYIDGWDEWQEGDWKVAERMKRVRERQKSAKGDTVPVTVGVTVGDTNPTVSGLSEPLAVGGRLPAVGGRPLQEAPPSPSASTAALRDAIQNGHTDDLALQYAVRTSELLGRDLAPLEVSMCGIFLEDFAYLSVDDMLKRMHDHVEHCKANNLPTPRKLHGFRETLRLENEHRADARAPKAWRVDPIAVGALIASERDPDE